MGSNPIRDASHLFETNAWQASLLNDFFYYVPLAQQFFKKGLTNTMLQFLGIDLTFYKSLEAKKLYKNYFLSICRFFLLFLFINFVKFFNFKMLDCIYLIDFLKILHITLGVAAVSATPGIKIATWSGDTPIEKLNKWIIVGLIFVSGAISFWI